MKVDSVPSHTLNGAVALLQPFCKELTPQRLIEGLRRYDPDSDEAQTKSNPPHYVDVNRAADALQVSRYTVVRHLKSGAIDGVKVGRQWRVPLSELNPEKLKT